MNGVTLRGAGTLVTGGSGAIGSAFVDRLLDRDVAEVVVLDNLVQGLPRELGRGARVMEVSVGFFSELVVKRRRQGCRTDIVTAGRTSAVEPAKAPRAGVQAWHSVPAYAGHLFRATDHPYNRPKGAL